MRITKLQLLYSVLSLLFVLLQIQIWFGQHSVFQIFHVAREKQSIVNENQKLDQRNQLLYEQINALKNNGQAIEGRARYDLGMIKKGEVYYQFRPTSATPSGVDDIQGELNAHTDHE